MSRLRRYYRQDAALLGEWVRMLNFRNTRLNAARPCSVCGRAAHVIVWYSLKTEEVRCLGCFDAVDEQYRRDVYYGRRYA
jgi:hypothetical protein